MREAPKLVPTEESLDEAVTFVEEMIGEADKKSIPRKNAGNGIKRRPLPEHILVKIKEKRKLRNRLTKHKESHLKPKINLLDRTIKKEIKEYEEEQQRKKWENCTDKTQFGFYKLSRELFNPRSKASSFPIKDQNDQPVKSDQEKAQCFHSLYTDIYKPPPETDESKDMSKRAEEFRQKLLAEHNSVKEYPAGKLDRTVTPETIRKCLKKAKNTSPGEDGVYYQHIRNLPEIAMKYLADIYHLCWKCCYFPKRWKTGITVLLPKPGKDPSSPKNYRPITLLSTLGKTFERVLKIELTDLIEREQIFPPSQAGFRSKRSTQDKLLQLVQEARLQISQDKVTVATFFDIEKAFDKMCHAETLYKMKVAGIDDHTIALIMSYLSDRSIKLRVNEELSDEVQLNAGPQGGIISPILFGIWVSDIPQPEEDDTDLSQFADDTATWANGEDLTTACTALQRFNDRITGWCRQSRILLSAPKTQVIVFSKKPIPDLRTAFQHINGQKIESSKEITFLGVVLDAQLNLKQYHHKVLNEIKRRSAIMRVISGSPMHPRAPTDMGIKIVQSMIEPLSYYAATINVLKTDTMFKNIDSAVISAYRKAIHVPKCTSGDYVSHHVGYRPSKDRTLKLATNYIQDPNRPEDFKNYISKARQSLKAKRKYRVKTPLDIVCENIQ